MNDLNSHPVLSRQHCLTGYMGARPDLTLEELKCVFSHLTCLICVLHLQICQTENKLTNTMKNMLRTYYLVTVRTDNMLQHGLAEERQSLRNLQVL